MFVEEQYLKLRSKYPYLFIEKKDDGYSIRGAIFIEKDEIKDQYEIEIKVPVDYPKRIPIVKEIGSKIDQTFHQNPDGTLCLEAPLTVYQVFRTNETIIHFIDKLIIPYLYNHSYYLIHGRLPSGEHAHGVEGIFEDYKRRFKLFDDLSVLRLIQILAEKSYRGHHICPCGNGKKIRDCHGKYLSDLVNLEYNYMKDYIMILVWLKKDSDFDVTPFISRKLRSVINKMNNNKHFKWDY